MKNSMTRPQKIEALGRLVGVLLADKSIPLPYDVEDGPLTLYCHGKKQLETTCRALGDGIYSEDDNGFIFVPHTIPFVRVYGFKRGPFGEPDFSPEESAVSA